MKNKYILIRQNEETDCGIACLQMIIEHYKGYIDKPRLRSTAGTGIYGTTLLGLYEAALNNGFDADGCKGNIESLAKENSPLILHFVNENNTPHYIVCWVGKYENGILTFTISDPAKGILCLTSDELNILWKSKACLILKPNKNFVKRKAIKTRKRKWFEDLIRTEYPVFFVAIIFGVIITALSISVAIFSQELIDNILPKKDYQKLYAGILLLLLILISKEILTAVKQYLLLRQARSFNIRITDFFYGRLLHLPKPFLDTRRTGELTARLNDTSRIQKVISQIAGSAITDVLIVLATVVFLFSYSASMGLTCVTAIPIFFFIVHKFNKPVLKQQRVMMGSYAHTEANFVSTLLGIEHIKNHNTQNLFASVNKNIYKSFQEAVFRLGKIQINLSFAANGFSVIFLIVVLLYGSRQVLYGQLKPGEFVAILTLSGSLLPSIANLALLSIPINEAKVAFDRMFEFANVATESNDSAKTAIDSFTSFAMHQLSFRFAGYGQLLTNISLHITKGELIAIVGENGSGKSTICQLIQKNYEYEQGDILINENISLTEINLTDWRKLYATVPQSIHIFNGTVLENIAFGDAAEQSGKVIDFLTQYGFMQFMERLPYSIYTIVGEEGTNLSGGQKQMIALARALYKKPQLLVLDEATAAMDRESEKFVLQLLTRLKKEMAVIFITHKLHILKSFCDRIYILENGIITAAGKHDDLLRTENLYSRYWADLV